MGLRYRSDWKYGESGLALSAEARKAFSELVDRIIADSSNPKWACEVLKQAYGAVDPSSTESWARHDLSKAMASLEDNAPRYIESLYNGLESLGQHEVVPDNDTLNMILKKNGEPFLISPPDLLHLAGDARLSEEVDTTAQLAIDRYVRLGLIGYGGFGEVYHVQRKTSLGSFDFAMKILSPSVFSNAAKAEQRFRREIESLKRLQHRAIVPILESGVLSDSRPYYIMPLIEGQDFREATEGKDISTRLEVFLNVLEGVQFAHSIGVLHRDLKPRNIIVRKADNQAMILDFGAAFLLDDFEGDTLTTENIGTLGYIPIEVQNNPRLRTEKHDVYSCGILLYEAFARFLPNPQEYSPLSTFDKSWAPLDEVIQSAIAPSGTRLSSITEFRQRIESILRKEKASI